MSKPQVTPIDVFAYSVTGKVRVQQFFDKDMAFQFALSLFNSAQCNVCVCREDDRLLTLIHDLCPYPLSRPLETVKK